MKYMFRIVTALALIVFTSPYVLAGVLAIPHTFTNGTVANADQINANSRAVETEVNNNDSRITTNATKLSENMAEIRANGGAIVDNTIKSGTNMGNIAGNTSAIDGNTGAIAGNTSAIAGKLSIPSNSCQSGQAMGAFTIDGGVTCVSAPAVVEPNSIGQDKLKHTIPGVAWADNSSPILLDSHELTTTVTSVSITPPASSAGFLVASASAQIHMAALTIAETVKCGLSRGLPDFPDIESWVRWESKKDDSSVSLDSVFAFKDGKSEEGIYLLCKRVNKQGKPIPPGPAPDDEVIVLNANLNVIFVPMDYNTTP